MKRPVLFVILFLLCGCAITTSETSSESVSHYKPILTSSQEGKWMKMVGKWYGEQPTINGGKRSWVVEREIDGTYSIVFRNYFAEGQYSESAEVGLWGVSGPVYFTMFRGHLHGVEVTPADPSDPHNYDAYEILQLDKQIFKYRDYETGTTFTVNRVDSDFRFSE